MRPSPPPASPTVTAPDGDAASTSYAYTGAGQLRQVATDIETVTYGYDGLGRNASIVTDLGGPEIATWTWWDGDTVAGITSTQGVDAGIVTDPVGQVLLQSGAPGAASSTEAWLLQDVRSSTTATATGQGRVTDVTGYSDFGAPTLPTEGWAAVASFTGKASATSEGLGQFPARTYDPLAGSWLTADPYRGSIADPASLNRYAYVTGDPATLIDPTGNAGSRAILGDAPRGKALPSIPAKTKALGTTSRPKNPGVGRGSPRDASLVPDRHPTEMAACGSWNAQCSPLVTSTDTAQIGRNIGGFFSGVWGGILDLVDSASRLSVWRPVAIGLTSGWGAALRDQLDFFGGIGTCLSNLWNCGGQAVRDDVAADYWATRPGEALGRVTLNVALTAIGGVGLVKSGLGILKAGTSAVSLVNLASSVRTNHILNGDATGGGHLWPGLPEKSPFPQSWSADEIMDAVSDIATNPSSWASAQVQGSRTVLQGWRDGVQIKVVVETATGEIVTGTPINLPRNPK